MSFFAPGPTERAAEGAEAWLTAGRFAALLGLFIFALFPDVILGTRTFYFRDFGLYGYPVAFYHRESFWRGEIPLWNPLSNCGLPFLAEWSTLAWYPFSLFYLLLPLSWSLGVFCLLHLFLGGMGMYWLAERWTGNRLAAAVAGVAFTFNGFMLGCLIWPHYMVSMGWLPLVLLTVPKAWHQGGRTIVWAALAGSMQMLGGPPEVILATWGLLGGLWLGQLCFEKPFQHATVSRFLFVIVLVTALCAAQIFPFLELLAHSQRDRNYGSGGWSMPSTGWANLLVPILYMQRSSAGVYLQPEQGVASSYYAGIGVLLLALISLAWVRRWWCWLLAGVAAICLTLAMGDQGQLFLAAHKIFPPIGLMRYPIKLIIPLTAIFPLLAAWALAALLRREAVRRTSWLKGLGAVAVAMLGCIGFLLWFSRRFPLNAEPWMDTALNGLGRSGILITTLATLVLLAGATAPRRRRALGFVLIGLVWIDLATHLPSQNPTVERAVYEPGLQDIQSLRPKPTPGDSRAMLSLEAIFALRDRSLTNASEGYLCRRLALFDDLNVLDDTPKVDGFYSLYLREEEQVRLNLYPETNSYRAPLADFMSVSQVTSPTNYLAFTARTNYLPMASAGQAPVFLEATNTVAAMLQPDWDPRKVVFLRPEARTLVTVTNLTTARILSSNWTAHRITLNVEAEAPSLVVLSQAFYRPWQAAVAGRPTPVLRANHAFQAVQVPAGRSELTLVYRDQVFRISAIISLLTLLACIIVLVRTRPRVRPEGQRVATS